MSTRATCLYAIALATLSCRDVPARQPLTAAPANTRRVLPDIAGFLGDREESGASYVRRTYVRGSDSTTVTLASFPMTAGQNEDWVRMSTAAFPQADLAGGPTEGNGFYECAPNDPARCNLLVQLRCGAHIEIRGSPFARREHADAILRGLGHLAYCDLP